MQPDEPPTDDALTDAALLAAVAAGREDALVGLYRRHHRDIYRFAFTMTQSRSLAQDVTQDVFLNVIENSARFDPAKGSARAWLLGCARHRVLDRLRLERRWTHVLPEQSVACANDEHVYLEQRVSRLYAAIADLPVEYREALVLCELEELSYLEAATVLGCPIGTVRSRLHRARAALTARFDEADTHAANAGPSSVPPNELSPHEACS